MKGSIAALVPYENQACKKLVGVAPATMETNELWTKCLARLDRQTVEQEEKQPFVDHCSDYKAFLVCIERKVRFGDPREWMKLTQNWMQVCLLRQLKSNNGNALREVIIIKLCLRNTFPQILQNFWKLRWDHNFWQSDSNLYFHN